MICGRASDIYSVIDCMPQHNSEHTKIQLLGKQVLGGDYQYKVKFTAEFSNKEITSISTSYSYSQASDNRVSFLPEMDSKYTETPIYINKGFHASSITLFRSSDKGPVIGFMVNIAETPKEANYYLSTLFCLIFLMFVIIFVLL